MASQDGSQLRSLIRRSCRPKGTRPKTDVNQCECM